MRTFWGREAASRKPDPPHHPHRGAGIVAGERKCLRTRGVYEKVTGTLEDLSPLWRRVLTVRQKVWGNVEHAGEIKEILPARPGSSHVSSCRRRFRSNPSFKFRVDFSTSSTSSDYSNLRIAKRAL